MNKDKARQLVQLYVDGWKENNEEKIFLPLSQSCTIIESHGPTYHGKGDVKEWIEVWIREKWKVDAWDITSFFFSGDTVVFEWVFRCSRLHEPPIVIEGITLAKVEHEKIVYL